MKQFGFIVLLMFVVGPQAACRPAAAQPVRGVTISTHGDGRDWGDDAIVPTMAEIQELGATWVATHPYGWIRHEPSVGFRPIDPDDPPAYLTRPIREAHALGLKILIKPHLGYWGSPFSWRGDIEFETDAQWDEFFSTYKEWIVAVAAACRDADGFVVGTELDRTLKFEDRWRDIIAAVREVTPAPLTYAANWTDYQNVTFWDDLDVIGIQAYFPVAATHDAPAEEIAAGWRDVMGRMSAFAKKHQRSIVFTELGYSRAFSSPVEPWAYAVDSIAAERVQSDCLRLALNAVDREESVLGAFLWKWFPQPHQVGRNFQLATPAMRETIGQAWR